MAFALVAARRFRRPSATRPASAASRPCSRSWPMARPALPVEESPASRASTSLEVFGQPEAEKSLRFAAGSRPTLRISKRLFFLGGGISPLLESAADTSSLQIAAMNSLLFSSCSESSCKLEAPPKSSMRSCGELRTLIKSAFGFSSSPWSPRMELKLWAKAFWWISASCSDWASISRSSCRLTLTPFCSRSARHSANSLRYSWDMSHMFWPVACCVEP
mmetsp:Transcript_37548/g.60543  ORF Transcript_37548/g.60543 Transcript_37548/m.60543 type:complete len:219 (-) Transcript_37548:945-1601(-)